MDSFLDEIEPVEFDPGYQPERHERFRIADYELPDWLADESSLTLPDLDRMDKNQASVNSIAGTVGMARDEQGDDLMMFQNFTSSRVIRPGRILFLEGNTYEGNDRPGMTLDTVLSAMYRAVAVNSCSATFVPSTPFCLWRTTLKRHLGRQS